ncbi:hypothetical protein [Burkholderia gladioli]|uniref:hypothetical protein n=1 Tax=Burkholderia gladioli TaxID=28095 RepID=UPI001ABAA3A2|nr:hypothetical protein [Burkholderia gladioli]
MLAATVASITGEPDVYNIVDDDPLPVAQWMPAFARWVDAPASRRLSAEDALDTAGEEAVYYHTRLSGASNPRAREKLGFSLARYSGNEPAARRHRPPGRSAHRARA